MASWIRAWRKRKTGSGTRRTSVSRRASHNSATAHDNAPPTSLTVSSAGHENSGPSTEAAVNTLRDR